MNSTSNEEIQYLKNLGDQVKKLVFASDHATNQILSIYHPQSEASGIVGQVETLSSLALKVIFKNYKGNSLHEYIQLGDKIYFGENLDVNMKLDDVIGLDNEVYWRRVAENYCNDKISLLAAKSSKNFYWKAFGVECKFTNIIENMWPNEFLEEKFIPLAKLASSFVTNLNIQQMMPIKDQYVEKNIYNPKYVCIDYPSELCHHLNLGIILAELTNLTSVSLQYGVEKCQYEYNKRYFEISCNDIEQLANGIRALKSLKLFRFKHTRLDDEKLRILTKGLVKLPSLESLDILYCNLKNDSGKSLAYLLENNTSLKSLNLKGNEIESTGCRIIGYGLQQRHETLMFLGMSGCPIGAVGVMGLGGGFKGSNHCSKLDFSFCSVGKDGAMRIVEILSFHKHIVSLNIAGIPLGYFGGTRLIELIENCFKIIELECRSCDLTRGQECKLNILIQRNVYYNDHPFLLKSVFTESDQNEIEDLLEMKRQTDLSNMYADCELLRPPNEVYPDSLNGMTSTKVSDLPEEFLSDFDTNQDTSLQTLEIKLLRTTKQQNSVAQ